jgi:hypothetical protein
MLAAALLDRLPHTGIVVAIDGPFYRMRAHQQRSDALRRALHLWRPALTTTERSCFTCGQPIKVTSRNPNRRFCSPRCRVADWHFRNDRPGTAVPNAVPTARDVPNDIPPQVNAVPTTNGVPAANGVQRCPNCHHELAVIAVVVPAKAAHIRTPEVITTDTT